MWGYEHRGGSFVAVKAWRGRLSPRQEGIQFTTPKQPDKFTPNNLAMWRLPSHGGSLEVETRIADETRIAACITVAVGFCRYCCKT